MVPYQYSNGSCCCRKIQLEVDGYSNFHHIFVSLFRGEYLNIRGAEDKNSGGNSKIVVKVKKIGLRLDRSEPSDESEGSDLITVKLIIATRLDHKA